MKSRNRTPGLRGAIALCSLLLAGAAQGDDFRRSAWGATASDVQRQEVAELIGREATETGGFSLVFSASMLDQDARIQYVFDAKCERLFAGTISFAEPIDEGHFLGVIQTFSNIYGENPENQPLNGGSLYTWQDGATSIQFMHLPRGVNVPELADRPPTSITYWFRDRTPGDCDFGN